MYILRKAKLIDHDFLTRIDLKNDGYTISNEAEWTDQEKEEHSKKIKWFLTDQDNGAIVFEDSA